MLNLFILWNDRFELVNVDIIVVIRFVNKPNDRVKSHGWGEFDKCICNSTAERRCTTGNEIDCL